jgi:hypothetical protein
VKPHCDSVVPSLPVQPVPAVQTAVRTMALALSPRGLEPDGQEGRYSQPQKAVRRSGSHQELGVPVHPEN